MCLIGIAWKAHPDFPLVVAANRDEYHARATATSAWWTAAPQVLAGRDLQSGGTWMGVTRSGRFAALTNVREPRENRQDAPSRGMLVADFLTAALAPQDHHTQMHAHAARFNGFNLLSGTADELWYVGNRGGTLRQLPAGIYGLSNALLDTPWPKVTALKMAMGAALHGVRPEDPLPSMVSGLLPVLFKGLGDTRPAPADALPHTGVPLERERLLSCAKVISPVYGTRASTVLCVTRHGDALWAEQSYSPDGAVTHSVRESFSLG